MNTLSFNTHINTYSRTDAWTDSDTKPNDVIFNRPGTYVVTVDYPFSCGFNFNFKVDKTATAKQFLKELKSNYVNHYRKIDSDTLDDGYCHGIEDLYLEQLHIDNNKVTMDIGS